MIYLLLPYSKKQRKQTGYRSKRFYAKFAIFCLFPIVNVYLTFFLPVTGCPTGYLGPGTNLKKDSLKNCAGGANLYIDRKIFGESRINQHPKCRHIYGCSSFDEDGLLGTFNFIFAVYLGSMVGEYYLQKRKRFTVFAKHLLGHFLTAGSIGIILGAIPDFQFIPINSQLWSLSFVLLGHASSLCIFLALMALSINKTWSGWPFRAVGKNAVFILVFHQIVKNRFPFGYAHSGNHFDTVLSSLINCTMWVGLAILLHGYKFYIKY